MTRDSLANDASPKATTEQRSKNELRAWEAYRAHIHKRWTDATLILTFGVGLGLIALAFIGALVSAPLDLGSAVASALAAMPFVLGSVCLLIIVCAPFTWLAGRLWAKHDKARGRLHVAGVCPRCFYDLSGLAGDVCPECGGAIPEAAQRRLRAKSKSRRAAARAAGEA